MFLLFLIFLIVFSTIGANIYDKITYGDYKDYFKITNELFNLDNFYFAFLLNFRNSGANWPYVMIEYSLVNPDLVDSIVAYFYFIIGNFICYVVLANLFVLIVLQEYYSFKLKGENPVEKFDVICENICKSWNKYSENVNEGMRISILNFYKFLFEVKWEFTHKLAIDGKLDAKSVNKYLFQLNIKK